MTTLFEQLGGMTAIKTLANEFYDVMERDPMARELRDIHPELINSARNNLYRFLTHWLGGPEIFGNQYVNARWLELRHRHVDLGDQFVHQWLYCMDTAMKNLDFDDALKNRLNKKFRSMIAAMVRVREALPISN